MSGFHHLPEYVSAEHAYRTERLRAARVPRGDGGPGIGRMLAARIARAVRRRPVRAAATAR